MSTRPRSSVRRGRDAPTARADRLLSRIARHGLVGKGAHVETGRVFAGLDWKLAGTRPGGAPHSLHQLLNHLTYWQEWAVQWLDGMDPPLPLHAALSWPGPPAPTGRADWDRTLRRYRQSLAELDRRAREVRLRPGGRRKGPLEMLYTIGAHNSYHAGQAALLRQLLGAWPPPSGGLTW